MAASLYAETYNKPIAVFVYPAEEDIDKAQKNYNDKDYSVWVDHGTSYTYEIENHLRIFGINTVASEDRKFVFIAEEKKYKLSIENREYPWSVIMFNGKDAPRLYEYPYDPEALSYYKKTIETGPKTSCTTDSDCWCRNFNGSRFYEGKAVSRCMNNKCVQCIYD